MPRPAIIMPKSVSIARDGLVYVWKTPAGGSVENNPIGTVRRASAAHGDSERVVREGGWLVLDRKGDPAYGKDGKPIPAQSGQRAAARELCRSLDLWPEES